LQPKQQQAKESELEALAEALKPIAVAMLKGNLSASALVQAAKLAYLRAAMQRLSTEGRKTNVSRLSVITGMTRKEIASYLPRKTQAAPAAGPKRKMEHRALRVLRAWTTDPRYKTASGRVIDLPMEGSGTKTFSSLVRSHGGDVTTVAVLRELERLRVVSLSESGRVRIRPVGIEAQLRAPARFRYFSRLLADFSETAAQVLVERERPLYFGFRDVEVTTQSQAEKFKTSFGRRASLLLEGVEHWHLRQAGKGKSARAVPARKGQRIGLGVYLVDRQSTTERQLVRRSRHES
jgi:hypothetical protein